MPVIEWRQSARNDLLEIVAYIANDNPDAAQALKDELEAKAESLLANPRLYKVGRVSGTREMLVRKNYVLIYVESPETVSILRILHTARQWPT